MDQQNLETGVEIGDFRIERRLGAGGMGIVYLARQISLNRPVALKILGGALTREADRLRFQREAQAVAKLKHPGIAGVYFIGQDRHLCYMAMEFIEGVTLRAILDRLADSHDPALTFDLAAKELHARDGLGEAREARFDQPTPAETALRESPPDGEIARGAGLTSEAKRLVLARSHAKRCCEVARDAALALAHAHERGVVHRDIKPENILIDQQGRVHLIDFGVARFFEDATLTNTGALVGTPMYMSPEQATGQLDLDHRTDLYSLGLMLYELLTLARPIASPTREGILRQILTKSMPPASWQNSALPRDLEGVVHKAIAKDPDDRYQTADDFAADLGRWLAGKPVTALPYRYRLDPREIKAERPGRIIVVAFVHFLISAFATIIGSSGLLAIVLLSDVALRTSLGTPNGLYANNEAARAGLTVFSACALAVAGYALWAGFGLLAANRWASRITIGLSSALAAFFELQMVRALLQGRLLIGELLADSVIAALAGSMVYVLLRRSTRDWFRLADRVRAEHTGPSRR